MSELTTVSQELELPNINIKPQDNENIVNENKIKGCQFIKKINNFNNL